ncbi:hypothetical protein F4861DRAFT_513263 [Xylaria intraflava]|nr:hypothetical protein F4861DRAFT_513263 [Xylaria intraflava]
MAQEKPQLLKLSVQHYKHKDVSQDDFYKWLHAEHIPVAAEIVKKHNIVRWSTTLNPVAMQQAFGEELHSSLGKPAGWVMADFDAVTNYWVRDPNDIRALMRDPEWAERVSAVEVGWIDPERASILVGFENVFIDDGEILPQAQ